MFYVTCNYDDISRCDVMLKYGFYYFKTSFSYVTYFHIGYICDQPFSKVIWHHGLSHGNARHRLSLFTVSVRLASCLHCFGVLLLRQQGFGLAFAPVHLDMGGSKELLGRGGHPLVVLHDRRAGCPSVPCWDCVRH